VPDYNINPDKQLAALPQEMRQLPQISAGFRRKKCGAISKSCFRICRKPWTRVAGKPQCREHGNTTRRKGG